MIIREFLYVDPHKVSSLLAQLNDGIDMEHRRTSRSERRTDTGFKGVLGHYQGSGEEQYVTKTLGDLVFPSLEEALESEGMIRDLSDELSDEQYWTPDRLQTLNPLGSIVRITARGCLFDARYIASVFSGFATTTKGVLGLTGTQVSSQVASSKPKQQPAKKASQQQPQRSSAQLEDQIDDFEMGDVNGDLLRSFIRVSRGIFTPGLHLNLMPTPDNSYVVGARLQEGRQYLDGDIEVLFSRYGIGEQEWTLVGSIGVYGAQNQSTQLEPFVDGATVSRGKFLRYINNSIGNMNATGFMDLPQSPGFSVVPFAVYRTIPRGKGQSVELPHPVAP
ncbi:hypothetical protein Caci_8545 [Catenulispora acidiphila DSM 44928]|uniref:Uncharacterized protein n=1 Tax=Catenulispora acidiphila (strain DSM 44928 / JCM 14897 / NBRC 102108 / NRRL B-24433 / ID139908) TaxID=479433 RepID=C7PYP3_CATAD|nr:hypothetical protein [Catenulispora acidiphila]ACU77365.1 hypothetical protein Caci_8545 [Catenulispora acidiphila DSM 44928]